MLVSLVSWFILMPQVTDFAQELLSHFGAETFLLREPGARGVFVSIIVGFLSVSILDLLSRRTGLLGCRRGGVPTSVSLAFSALVPMALVLPQYGRCSCSLTPLGRCVYIHYSMLQIPLTM